MIRRTALLLVLLACVPASLPVAAADLAAAKQMQTDGNFQEALTAFAQLLTDGQTDSAARVEILRGSIECYRQLNEVHKIDAFREGLAKSYPEDWRLLGAVAQSYMEVEHHGYRIAGEFRRGQHRGGGEVCNAVNRDHVRSLQLFRQALTLLEPQAEQHSTRRARELLLQFADATQRGRNYPQAWRLQSLTNLNELPDYEAGWGYDYGAPQGAPVTAEGQPVYYNPPASWDAAASDGERWCWLLELLAAWQPDKRNETLLRRAEFLQSQFGVETLLDYGWWFGRPSGTDDDPQKTGTFALHTLAENETIARLATGIQRFTLPDDQNALKLYQAVLASTPANETTSVWQKSIVALAREFENRRQYPRAAGYWREASERGDDRTVAKGQLEQIVGNWGRFEPVSMQPAGKGATVDFRFRNGAQVSFTARRVKVRELLADVKAYLKDSPKQLNWDQVQIENLGHRLVVGGQEKYLGEEVARWSLDLDPLDDHFDKRITVTTPLQEPGAYLVTSEMEDGNTTSIILWLADTAIVKKPLVGKALYYVADANTGAPLDKCNVEFFGYWQEQVDTNQFVVRTQDYAELTDANGVVELPADEENRRHEWVAIASTPKGRFAFLGFRSVWAGEYYDQEYQQVKVFSITDRPVYRPGQQLHFKFWVRHAQYDLGDTSGFAAQSFLIEIRDPKSEKVYSTQLTSDAYGGLSGSWQVPAGATLGEYQIYVVNHGGGTFRVEEYKKPEFEVTVDAPAAPIKLGDKVTAKISANYYFGSPVTEATVKYKVLRTPHTQRWFPPMPWDWLYGPGYWWFGEDYLWYPGWRRWGCAGPVAWWIWRAPTPPEIIVEREVPLGPDGTVDVEIDTALAKELHPNQDQSYQIEAQVVDQSRRTIVGSGQVLVARKPFQVYVWTTRGHYRVADTIEVGVAARTLDAKPVAGAGTLKLLKIEYEGGKPVETEAGLWKLSTGETGQAQLQIKASEPGQYRLAYELTDAAGAKIEGGQMLTVAGAGFDGSQFQFNDLEVIPDRQDYQPGDKVALQINTNSTGAAVLLFLRPSNGVYLPPQLVRLTGKSTVVEVDVTNKDTPNFFVEAVTVHGGKVHTVVREIFVPPVKRILNVEVTPSAREFLPDQAATLKVRLTDEQGQPYVGSLVLSVYDKALDYISGGSNVADIREFFWKWRRSHQPVGETSLDKFGSVLVRPNLPTMASLGIFGDTVVDEINGVDGQGGLGGGDRRRRFAFGAEANRSGVAADGMVAEGAVMAPAAAALEAKSSSESATVAPTIRQNFADTALWVGALETNAQGLAEVNLNMPQNLTTWTVRAWGMGHGTRVGEGSAEVVTRKNIIVRLQAPRFFVERDEVVLSANVHNYLPQEKPVRVVLALEGDTLKGLEQLEQTVTIAAGGEQRVDWRVTAVREGTATIRMSALTDDESDAMQMSFPVYVHGMLKTESYTGVIRPAETDGQFTVEVPSERRAEQTRLEVRYTPTLAGAMVDALPYLIDYPYGCTEQTLNRFLPAVITQQTLRKMQVDLAAIQQKRTNLNAQEIGDDAERAQQWKRFDRNPVFDDAELKDVVSTGINRLTQMQLSDGGWGWFSGWGERSFPHTTAVVVHGLVVAQENGAAIVPDVLGRGVHWLAAYQAEQLRLLDNWQADPENKQPEVPKKQFADNIDALVLMALTEAEKAGAVVENTAAGPRMSEHLFRSRTQLAAYSLATYGLALHMSGDGEKLEMVMRNLGQFVKQDDENQTAWLELPADGWWYWYASDNEAMAYYLKLLVATEPHSEVAPRLVKYLLNNRKHGTYWNSTRDTALVVEAFADYLETTGEDNPNVQLEVLVDGQPRQHVSITRENLFTFDNKLVLTGDQFSSGRHTIELRKQGESPIYYNGYLTNFTLEDDIRAAGLELKVQRKFYKLTPAEQEAEVAGGQGQVVNQRVEKYERTEIVNLGEVKSGDLLEVELVIDSKNDYEYILLEDMKAAGCEPVEVRSGYGGNSLGAYMELRDDRVTLFITRLARGQHSVNYRLRAEIPGQFSALPTRASAMYAPELKANSDELKLRIAD